MKNVNLSNESENFASATKDHKPNKTDADVKRVIYGFNSNNVSSIPNLIFTIFPNLDTFSIRQGNNNLKVLEPLFFKNAKNLRALFIRGSKIKKLGPTLFKEAKNLRIIDLQINKISSIHVTTFDGLNQLYLIDLSGNKIKYLHPRTFTKLVSLIYLYFSENESCLNRIFVGKAELKKMEKKIEKNCVESEIINKGSNSKFFIEMIQISKKKF